MEAKTNITGIILAGGKSSRMGTDKGFVMLDGHSFMSHIIKAVKPLVKDIIIVSDNPDYDFFNLKRVEDIMTDAGPLAGLYSGLHNSQTENNIVLSCDVPLINTTVLNILIADIKNDIDIVQLESNHKTMPLVALYKKRCSATCLDLLKKGERRLRFAVNQFKTRTIVLDKHLEQYLKNINTIDELNALKNEIEH